MSVVKVNNLSIKAKGKLLLDDINFEMKPGEVFSLLGYNGAGKSTLLDILTGGLKPDQGSFSILDKSFRKAKNEIGVVYEDFNFFGYLKVKEIVSYLSIMKGHTTPDLQENIEALKLDKIWTRQFRFLSRGERKKIGILAAIMHEPKLLILDEPTSELDPFVRSVCWQVLLRKNRSILFSTHDWDEAKSYAHKVAFIFNGKLINVDTTEAFLSEKYLPFSKRISFYKRPDLKPIYDSYTYLEEYGQIHVYVNDDNPLIHDISRITDSYAVGPKSLKDVYLFLTQKSSQPKQYERS